MTAFLVRNWFWLLIVVLFVGMHRAGYGCGSHGGHHQHHKQSDTDDADDQSGARSKI